MVTREQYQSLSQFYYEELANALQISGILLAPGVWKNTIYAAEEIKSLYNKFKDSLMQMPLVVEHFMHPGYLGRVVGKHTKIRFDDSTGSILYQAEVTDPQAIQDIKNDKFIGTSVANWLDFIPGPDGLHATNLTPINNSLTSSPACKKCVIRDVKEMSDKDKDKSIEYYGMFPLSKVIDALSAPNCDEDQTQGIHQEVEPEGQDNEDSDTEEFIPESLKKESKEIQEYWLSVYLQSQKDNTKGDSAKWVSDAWEATTKKYGVKPETPEPQRMSCGCPFMDIREAKDAHDLSVIPFSAHTKAKEDTPWNFISAEYSVEQLNMACTVIIGDPKNKTSYKLPHHTPNGEVVWHGVSAALGAIAGARGGVSMPSSDVGGAKSHLLRHYAQFDKKPSENMSKEDIDAATMEILSIVTNLTQESESMSNNEPKTQEQATVPTVPPVTVATVATVQTAETKKEPVQPAITTSQDPVTNNIPSNESKKIEFSLEELKALIAEAVKGAIPKVAETPSSVVTSPPAEKPVEKPLETPVVATVETPANPIPAIIPTLTRQQVVDEVVKMNKDEILDIAAGFLIRREDTEERLK